MQCSDITWRSLHGEESTRQRGETLKGRIRYENGVFLSSIITYESMTIIASSSSSSSSSRRRFFMPFFEHFYFTIGTTLSFSFFCHGYQSSNTSLVCNDFCNSAAPRRFKSCWYLFGCKLVTRLVFFRFFKKLNPLPCASRGRGRKKRGSYCWESEGERWMEG